METAVVLVECMIGVYISYELLCLVCREIKFCCSCVCCCRNGKTKGGEEVGEELEVKEEKVKEEDEEGEHRKRRNRKRRGRGKKIQQEKEQLNKILETKRQKEVNSKTCKGIRSPDFDSFLTSALQCLISIPEFFRSQENEEMKDTWDFKFNLQMSVSNEIKDFKRRYFDDNYKEIDIMNIRRCFTKVFPRFRHHDSFDLLMVLFEDIQKEINPTMAPFIPNDSLNYKDICQEYEKSHPSIVDQLFVGLSKLIYACQDCGNDNIIYDEFKYIQLDCTHQSSTSVFEEFLANINRGQYCHYRCKKCQCDSLCMLARKIIKYPKYLLIVIQKEECKSQTQSDKPIDYKDSFSLSTLDSQTVTYTLESIICKSQALIYNHYSAICKRESEWVLFDNTSCYTVSETLDLYQRPDSYILFYKAEDHPEL
ncbi:unnamed protein product [Moneuplotes crassus]|uniref:USP domain-containing protein n=1 Tax=Euplotes crassus TaxID=5936 RepID=A0AAD1USN0_EUPCR|nr:unnamed protein product [Moneuplotes crassus]